MSDTCEGRKIKQSSVLESGLAASLFDSRSWLRCSLFCFNMNLLAGCDSHEMYKGAASMGKVQEHVKMNCSAFLLDFVLKMFSLIFFVF